MNVRTSWTAKIILLFLAISLSGCALTYEDENGNKRVVGFVSMTFDESHKNHSTVEIENLGLLIINTDFVGGMSLGYSSERYTTMKRNSCVVIPVN